MKSRVLSERGFFLYKLCRTARLSPVFEQREKERNLDRRIRFFVYLAVIVFIAAGADAAVTTKPVIRRQGSNWTLDLPKNIKKAIRDFNSEFRPWDYKDYAPRIRNSYKKTDPAESPFALIVDANDDGKPDVIIDGHDRKRDMLIGVVSDRDRYKICIIKESELSDPASIVNWDDKKKEKGLNYFLWLKKDRVEAESKSVIFQIGYPQVEFEDGTATDGALVGYLYENGTFREKINEL